MNRRDFLKIAGVVTAILMVPVVISGPKIFRQKKIKETKNMKQIFEPVKLNNLHMKNRLVRSATWEGIATPDGGITDNTYKIYEDLARGGIGAIITGFTSVSANDFYFGGMMRLCDDKLIPQYKKLTDIVHKYDCPIISQLALGAYYRKNASGQYEQVEPDDMYESEINMVIQEFKDAAVRAQNAGFDGVQIHAAHFFFLSRFISPHVNHRLDSWGGDTRKRMNILLEILQQIRLVAPQLHISIKINSDDFIRGGLTQAESMEICRRLSDAGIDSIEVSGNGTSVQGIIPHVNEGYFVDFAKKLANSVSTPVIVVGGIRSREKMEEILSTTDITALSMSRPLIREPDLPNKLKNNEVKVSKCVSCNACYSSPSHRCIFQELRQ